ncbi:MAG: RNase adapter RapZ, partial [Acidobacteriota bacterium]
PEYVREGKTYLTVSFGCTGGRHRSVALAEEVGRFLQAKGLPSRITHRDIDKE